LQPLDVGIDLAAGAIHNANRSASLGSHAERYNLISDHAMRVGPRGRLPVAAFGTTLRLETGPRSADLLNARRRERARRRRPCVL